ncbi:MAG: hypothetical protein ABIH34_03120 [Nanoarchaeota archaeon]
MKKFIVLVLLGIVIYLITSFIAFADLEYARKPAVQEKVEGKDIKGLYDFYVASTPESEGRPSYGDETASITIMVFQDPGSDASHFFMRERFPELMQEFIMPGKARFIPKYYLTLQDFEEKTDTFLYANTLACVNILKPDVYFDVYMESFTVSLEKLTTLITAKGITEEQLMECMTRPPQDLIQDLSEVEGFGIVGIAPRIYVGIHGQGNTILNGVPSYQRIWRSIRDQQILLGD